MRRGAVGDPEPWRAITGIVPRDIEHALLGEPASVQERWFARMYILKPFVFGVFGLFWIVTGLISLGPGYEYGMSLLREGGLPETFAIATLVPARSPTSSSDSPSCTGRSAGMAFGPHSSSRSST
jgi:hypothetical protein